MSNAWWVAFATAPLIVILFVLWGASLLALRSAELEYQQAVEEASAEISRLRAKVDFLLSRD